jgi:hypothetical protein
LQSKLDQLPPVNLERIAKTISLEQFWLDLSESERRFYLREFIKKIEVNQEVRSQESGVRSQESGVRSQESGVRSQESGVRSQESEVRSQKSGVRSQKSEVRSYGKKWTLKLVFIF